MPEAHKGLESTIEMIGSLAATTITFGLKEVVFHITKIGYKIHPRFSHLSLLPRDLSQVQREGIEPSSIHTDQMRRQDTISYNCSL